MNATDDLVSPITGFSHVQLAVSDVARAERWYLRVLGLQRMHASDDGSYVALVHRPSRVVIVLSAADEAATRAALDHLAFAVPDAAGLGSRAR